MPEWGDDDQWEDAPVEYTGNNRVNGFFHVLADEDEDDEDGDDDEEEEVSVSEDVCLYPSAWERWTRAPDEVCLFPSVWREWTRTQPRKHGRVRGSGGRRTTSRKNKKRRCPRRRQERRRRRAVRRKQLARRARVGGRRRRPPASFRGGGDPLEGDQVRFVLGMIHESVETNRAVLAIPSELHQPTHIFLYPVALQRTGEETAQAAVQETGHTDPEPPTNGKIWHQVELLSSCAVFDI